MKKLLLTGALGAILSVSAHAQMQVNSTRSNFDYPAFTLWFDAFSKIDASAQFNYQSVGSGAGQKDILAQTVDFGASDAPMTDAAMAKAPYKILHLPVVAGAVAVTYNLPDSPKLRFDGDTLAGIFLGTITKWNDPALAALNPGVQLPDLPIVVVHRSDGSGTTFIFTDYLSSVSSDWASKVGKKTAVNWPVGLGGKGSEGISGQVKQLPGSIGYVELAYAVQNNLPVADLKNSSGNPSHALAGDRFQRDGDGHDPGRLPVLDGERPRWQGLSNCRRHWVLVYQTQVIPIRATNSWRFSTGRSPTARSSLRGSTMRRSRRIFRNANWAASTPHLLTRPRLSRITER